MTEEQRIVEPLAKWHPKVYIKGRIRLVSSEKEAFRLEDGDTVKLIIRKIQIEPYRVLGRAYFEGLIVSGGNITIPKKLMEELGIKVGETVEVLLVGFSRLKEMLPPEHYEVIKRLKRGSYKIISEEEEKEILNTISFSER